MNRHSSSNTTSMITDTTFTAKAVALRQRFFGELIYSSLMSQETPDLENVRSQKPSIEQDIAVVTLVASTMAALLLCTAASMSYMVWATTVRRRPLNLLMDPATVAGVALFLRNDRLVMTLTGSVNSARRHSSINRDWRPGAIRTISLTSLLCVMAVVAAAFSTLYILADRRHLYRSAFVYQTDIGIFEAKILPIGAVATLSAVCVRTTPTAVLISGLDVSDYLANAPRPH
jgi:hypothetical protein